MDRTHLNKKIVFMDDQPQNVRLMGCPVCKIETNHVRTAEGWKCRVCDDLIQPDVLGQRQNAILYEVAKDPGLLTNDVVEELADLGKAIDGGGHES